MKAIMQDKKLFAALLIFVSVCSLCSHAWAGELPKNLYNIDIPDEDLNQIQSWFPASGDINPSFIASDTDPNLHLLEDARISVSFISEQASYLNSFGYFVYDVKENSSSNDKNKDKDTGGIASTPQTDIVIKKHKTIFKNASAEGSGGLLNTGDTLDLGKFKAGDNIGFWLQANGYNDKKGDVYYTLDNLNPDGLRHMAVVSDPENDRIVMGIEDLYNLGDADYNDLIFTIAATPFGALDGSDLPTGAPEPGAMAASGICLGLFSLFGFKKRK